MQRTVKKRHRLKKNEITEIESLVRECLSADGLERYLYLHNDLNYYKDMDCFFLMYQDDRLVSVLAVFAPLAEEAEISAYTLPSQRRKGFFKALLGYAEKELAGYGIEHILFVAEPASSSVAAVMQACRAGYAKSEYLMTLAAPDYRPVPEDGTGLPELRSLTEESLEKAAALCSELFGSDIKEDLSMLKGALESEQMDTYCTFLAEDMLGICNVSMGSDSACIFGFGIKPEYQGKGYGRRQLRLLLAKLFGRGIGTVTLEVGSRNERAFSLYKGEGFRIKTQYDYYECKIM